MFYEIQKVRKGKITTKGPLAIRGEFHGVWSGGVLTQIQIAGEQDWELKPAEKIVSQLKTGK